MRVTVTGATGLIGTRLVERLLARGDEVTVLSRNADRAREHFGGRVEAVAWDPKGGPAPVGALAGRDAVVNLMGENIAQRWNAKVKQELVDSRVQATRNLVAGFAAAGEGRPGVLASGSASGFYGPRGDERITEATAPAEDFLGRLCVDWEQAAVDAEAHGVRVVLVRTGIVLDADGGALAKMLPPFKAGVGGPVAGGRQFMPWIHRDDVVGILLAALDDASWAGPVNATAPEPVTNKDFSKALGRVLHRPAALPVPSLPLKAMYGEMASIVTTGARVVPERTLALGYRFAHPDLEPALADALGKAAREPAAAAA